MSSAQRLLLEQVVSRTATLAGAGHSGLDLSAPGRVRVGRFPAKKLPGKPPIAFVYRQANQTRSRGAMNSRTRAPKLFLDCWHGKGSHPDLHLRSIDLEADLLALMEDPAWLISLRQNTDLQAAGLRQLQLAAVETTLFPGHFFSMPDRACVRLVLSFSWSTPCRGGT